MNYDPFAGPLGVSSDQIADALAAVVVALAFAPLVGLALVCLIESLIPRKDR